VTPLSLESICRRFGDICYLFLQRRETLLQDFELHAGHFILCFRFKTRLIAFHIENDEVKICLFEETVSDA
jgi:hypothetical protein